MQVTSQQAQAIHYAVKNHHHLCLCGYPGSGKTTTLVKILQEPSFDGRSIVVTGSVSSTRVLNVMLRKYHSDSTGTLISHVSWLPALFNIDVSATSTTSVDQTPEQLLAMWKEERSTWYSSVIRFPGALRIIIDDLNLVSPHIFALLKDTLDIARSDLLSPCQWIVVYDPFLAITTSTLTSTDTTLLLCDEKEEEATTTTTQHLFQIQQWQEIQWVRCTLTHSFRCDSVPLLYRLIREYYSLEGVSATTINALNRHCAITKPQSALTWTTVTGTQKRADFINSCPRDRKLEAEERTYHRVIYSGKTDYLQSVYSKSLGGTKTSLHRLSSETTTVSVLFDHLLHWLDVPVTDLQVAYAIPLHLLHGVELPESINIDIAYPFQGQLVCALTRVARHRASSIPSFLLNFLCEPHHFKLVDRSRIVEWWEKKTEEDI